MIALFCGLAFAGVVALEGATLHPVDGPQIPTGVVLIEDGRILAVGAEVEIPAGAQRVDLSGKHVIPGLVDLHSHVGGGRLHEHLDQTQPGIGAVDAIDPTHISIQRAQAGGITTANVMPGSGKLMGGQTAYLDLVDTAVIEEMLRCDAPADGGPLRWTAVCGGVKMANGTNPQGDGGDPASRMGSAFLQRETLRKGQERLDAVEKWRKKLENKKKRAPDPEALEPDLDADALVEILEGRRIVHFHSHRADDLLTALRLREEFGFELVLQHGSEGFKIAEEIAAAGVPVAINVLDTPGGKEETLERQLGNPAALAAAGVTVAIITDDPVQDSRLLLRSAGLAVRGGLDAEAALHALTLAPAAMIGLDAEIGSLTAGKEADLVVLSGPPLSAWSLVEQTWNDGELVFDRADPAQAFHATGGDAATPETP